MILADLDVTGDVVSVLLRGAEAGELAERVADFGRRAGAVVDVAEVREVGGWQVVLTRERSAALREALARRLREAGCEVAG